MKVFSAHDEILITEAKEYIHPLIHLLNVHIALLIQVKSGKCYSFRTISQICIQGWSVLHMTQITYDTDYNPIKKQPKKWKSNRGRFFRTDRHAIVVCTGQTSILEWLYRVDNQDDITNKSVSGVKKTIFILIHMQIQASRDIIKSHHCTDALCEVGVILLITLSLSIIS